MLICMYAKYFVPLQQINSYEKDNPFHINPFNQPKFYGTDTAFPREVVV